MDKITENETATKTQASEQKHQISASKPIKQPIKALRPYRLGRPTKYKVGYCQNVIDFFTQDLYHDRIKSTITQKNGSQVVNYEQAPNPPIWFSDFAYSIGTDTSTINKWIKLFPAFNVAYTRAKELQHNHIKALANMGLYNSNFAMFTMKNISSWRDKKDLELSGKVDSQVFFASMLEQSEQALANERQVIGSRN